MLLLHLLISVCVSGDKDEVPFQSSIIFVSLEFEKQEIKRKLKFHGVKNIKKRIRLYC